MSRPIERLEMTGFRGATSRLELDFDLNKDLTLIFGENGSGKSTILDAIDVVFNGGVGSLADISVGHNRGHYLGTLGSPRTAVCVKVQSGDATWVGTMNGNAMRTAGPNDRPQVRILRRADIHSLVSAQPSERYSRLKRYIDIGIVENSEESLKRQINSLESSINAAVGLKATYETQLAELWEAENRPGSGGTAMAWAKSTVDAGIAELDLNQA